VRRCPDLGRRHRTGLILRHAKERELQKALVTAPSRHTARMAELVAGVDGCKSGWVAVVLAEGRFREARLCAGVDTPFDELEDVVRIAIDVPIGYGPRRADALARALVGGSSVFTIPERERFEAPFGEGGGISAQAHALGDRIRHVTEIASRDTRFREAHPELCFTAMNGMRRLEHRKKSAGGAFERLALLTKHGINIDRGALGAAATVPLDDLLDAAACAWTAARRDAVPLPDPPEHREGVSAAIWY
jgi:predicted RNase H-like nuclease